MKHVVVVQRITGITLIGTFDSYPKADNYRNALIRKRRIDEDTHNASAPVPGSMSFWVTTLTEPDSELMAPPTPKTCCSGCCEHG